VPGVSFHTETSAVGRNAEFNEVVKCVIIVIKIKFNGLRCRVTERCGGCRVTDCVGCRGCRVTDCVGCRGCRVTDCVGCRGCRGCRVTERCVGCLHCLRLSHSISI
jgi:hypothetical protein